MVELTIYRKFWFVILVLTSLFTFFLAISQQTTPYFNFVWPAMFFQWVWFFGTWGYEYFTGNGRTAGNAGTSISLLGDHDPDTYILQKYLGYNISMAVAIVGGILISLLFVSEMLVSGQVWLPVSQPLSPSFQVPYVGIFTYFSAVNKQVIAFSNSVLPAIWENPALIYTVLFLGFFISKPIMRRFVGETEANVVALFIGLIIAAFAFPFIFHVFSYQAALFAYVRAVVFVLTLGTLSVLTGFDFPLLFGHFLNNWVASLFLAVSFGVILPPGM